MPAERAAAARPSTAECGQPGCVRADGGVGQQDVGSAGCSRHLRLGDRGGLEFPDAVTQVHFHDLRQFVGFHVRPEPLGGAGQCDHPPDVLLDPVGVDE
jgi:hypothetical protein